MKILTFCQYYLPGVNAGGPIRTISNMVEAIDEIEFDIVCKDRDFQSNARYADIEVNKWEKVGKSNVFYLSYKLFGIEKLFSFYKLIKNSSADIIYINSFFSPVFTLFPLLLVKFVFGSKIPVVLAPRGEFSEGALSLKSWKKQPYLRFTKFLGLYRNIVWHASSEHEARDIRRALNNDAKNVVNANDIVIVNNISNINFTKVGTKTDLNESSALKLLFLSRICKMKNLDHVLKVLQKVTCTVEFSIYGPVQDVEYWEECVQLIDLLPKNVIVSIKGAVLPEQVKTIMSEHDLFILPTLGENFGHVIIEALSSGVPVLISDKTQWGSDDFGACSVVPLEMVDAYVSVIETFAKYSPVEKEKMSEHAVEYAKFLLKSNDAISQTVNLFNFAKLHGSNNSNQ